MRNCHIFLGLCLLGLLVSCKEKNTSGRPVTGYLSRILADTTARDYSLVKAYSKESSEGSIYILGAPEDVFLMGEAFLLSDRSDNIDGKDKVDGLPDFAGETITPVPDMSNYPYEDYIQLSHKDLLREITLRNFVFAMDTTVLQSPFDTLHPVRKLPAKAVILSSTYSCIYGYSEIDSLCRRAAPSAAVISVLDRMMDEAFELGGKAVIWTTKDKLDGGAYEDFFKAENGMGYASRRKAKGLGDPTGKWQAFSPAPDSLREDGTLRGRFLDLLDNWHLTASEGEKLPSIVLDDRSVDPGELQAVIAELLSTDDDYMIHYRNMISPRCKCIWAEDAAANECYRLLRQRNSFTHRIAYPALKCYATAPSASLPKTKYDLDGSLSYSFKYNRENINVEDTYTFVELRDKYFSGGLLSFMKQRAPQSYSLYVR